MSGTQRNRQGNARTSWHFVSAAGEAGKPTLLFNDRVAASFLLRKGIVLWSQTGIDCAHDRVSAADVCTREWILVDVLRFQPGEGTEDVRKTYFLGGRMSATETQTWNLVFSAWCGALAIITLRYLYFGLPDPEIPAHLSRSPTPTPPTSDLSQPATHYQSDDAFQSMHEASEGYQFEGEVEDYFGLEHLSPESQSSEPIWSRAPSPLPSPRSINEPVAFDHWTRRLFALSIVEDISYLRYALLPLMVLALISRPNSNERALCLGQFERFKQFMAYERAGSTPIGGSPLDFDIRWDLLYAYSAEVEQLRGEDLVYLEPKLRGSAPEWNWFHMLKRIDLKNCWPASSGQMHMELGTEAFASNVLSAYCTE
ncbi:hypothetical protein EK21DRAFT_86217 [Setomelanomma holmii]|uniref:Uncharacterized protein n=1 Tax=Setomelanomma holmii TaxID=210430 RepID=A0A9P4LPQ7_9PLEO|nr:hypothetical protein EK21DRAFT_86217 [Setomelanomma holmii]